MNGRKRRISIRTPDTYEAKFNVDFTIYTGNMLNVSNTYMQYSRVDCRI